MTNERAVRPRAIEFLLLRKWEDSRVLCPEEQSELSLILFFPLYLSLSHYIIKLYHVVYFC